MSEEVVGRWERLKAQRLTTPELRARYDNQRRYAEFARQVAMRIDEERRRQHLTKAELARRIGTNPAAIRRLLTAKSVNPTLKTVFDAMSAVGLELRLEAVADPLEKLPERPGSVRGRDRVARGT